MPEQKVVQISIIDGHKIIHIAADGGGPVKPPFCPNLPGWLWVPCCTDGIRCVIECNGGCFATWSTTCIGKKGHCYWGLNSDVTCEPPDGCYCAYHYAGNDCV